MSGRLIRTFMAQPSEALLGHCFEKHVTPGGGQSVNSPVRLKDRQIKQFDRFIRYVVTYWGRKDTLGRPIIGNRQINPT